MNTSGVNRPAAEMTSPAPAGNDAAAGGSSAGMGDMPSADMNDMPSAGMNDVPSADMDDMPSADMDDMPGTDMDGMPGTDDMPSPDTGGALPDDGDYAMYHDPGTGPWEVGTPAECKLDPSRVAAGENLAVFRYGKLCHIQGGNTSIANWSATKTMGGVLAGRAAYLAKDVPRTGPGTGPILHEDKLSDWGVSTSGVNRDALLSHVMSMTAYNTNLAHGSKGFTYDTDGTREISRIVPVAMAAMAQLSGVPTRDRTFMQQEVFDKLGMEDSSWPGGTIGYGWAGSLEDMGRVGVMLAHDGWYGGERFMEASWVYRMSHPAHEDANTGYGQLAWLSNRGGASAQGSNIDECAPPAFWPEYPHVGSEATDCGSDSGSCELEHDVGVFIAAGLGGQYVIMHPGLDMVITGHNAASAKGLWTAVRPAVVAKDPQFMGDETAFCEAYGGGSYAPDLLVPRTAPTR